MNRFHGFPCPLHHHFTLEGDSTLVRNITGTWNLGAQAHAGGESAGNQGFLSPVSGCRPWVSFIRSTCRLGSQVCQDRALTSGSRQWGRGGGGQVDTELGAAPTHSLEAAPSVETPAVLANLQLLPLRTHRGGPRLDPGTKPGTQEAVTPQTAIASS